MHYIKWDNPPKQYPVNLTIQHFSDMLESGAPFGHPFAKDDHVLDKIDKDILGRTGNRFPVKSSVVFGKTDAIRPSMSSKRLEKLVSNLLSTENFRPKQCK